MNWTDFIAIILLSALVADIVAERRIYKERKRILALQNKQALEKHLLAIDLNPHKTEEQKQKSRAEAIAETAE